MHCINAISRSLRFFSSHQLSCLVLAVWVSLCAISFCISNLTSHQCYYAWFNLLVVCLRREVRAQPRRSGLCWVRQRYKPISVRATFKYLLTPCPVSNLNAICFRGIRKNTFSSSLVLIFTYLSPGLAIAWVTMFIFDSLVFSMTLYRVLTLPERNNISILTVFMRDGERGPLAWLQRNSCISQEQCILRM